MMSIYINFLVFETSIDNIHSTIIRFVYTFYSAILFRLKCVLPHAMKKIDGFFPCLAFFDSLKHFFLYQLFHRQALAL